MHVSCVGEFVGSDHGKKQVGHIIGLGGESTHHLTGPAPFALKSPTCCCCAPTPECPEIRLELVMKIVGY